MMKTEKVILAIGKTATLSVAGKWFRVRQLKLATGADAPDDYYVTVKALSTDGSKQLADGLTAYDGDMYGWDVDFRDLTFHNPNGAAINFEVIVSGEGRHDVSRPAVAIVGSVTVEMASGLQFGEDTPIAAGVTDDLTGFLTADTKKVTVQNDDNSPGPLRVGGPDVSNTNGFVLQPGASKDFHINNEQGFFVLLKVRNPTGAPGPCTYRLLTEDRGPA